MVISQSISKSPLLEVRDASFGYHRERPILNNIQMKLSESEIVIIRGQSSTGKSTLAKALTGLLGPISGSVKIHCKSSLLANKGLGLNPNLTVKENGLFRYYFFNADCKDALLHVQELIEFAGLSGFEDCPLRSLPSLVKARYALMLYLLSRFEIAVIDENFGLSDPNFRDKVKVFHEKFIDRCRALVVFSRNGSPFDNYGTRFGELHDSSLTFSE